MENVFKRLPVIRCWVCLRMGIGLDCVLDLVFTSRGGSDVYPQSIFSTESLSVYLYT